MKNIRIAIILLIVIAIIVGLLVYLNKEQPLAQDKTLYNYKNNAVEQIRIVSESNEVLFVKKQDEWVMIEPRQYNIDADALYRLENRLKDFLASRILEENTDDLQKYGLDNPKATISFKLNDGTENTLLIGEMTASKVQYYAKDSAREQIYILGSYDVENFLAPITEFRDRSILEVDIGSINAVSMDTGGIRDYKLVGDDSGTWKMKQPLETDARGDAVDEMLGDILELKIKDFITDNLDEASLYGLEKPAYTMEIGDSKQNTQKIYFGKIDEEEQVIYIKVDDYEEVYTLSLEVFDPRRFKITNFLNEAPLSVAIGDINKVTIIEDDTVVDFNRDTSKAEDIFTCAGETVNQEDFTTLYVNIMALTAEGYDPENIGGTPDLTVMLELRDNEEMIKVEFVKRDDLSYFIIMNGEPRPFYIGERKIDLIKKWRDRILEGI